MRKPRIIALTAAALCVFVGVAYAVTNTYQVSASTLPAKAGSAKKPVPLQLKFS